MLLLGVGDSITDGYGATPGRSYFDRLVKNPGSEFPDMRDACLSKVLPNMKARNISASGSTSLEHVKQLRDFPKQPADVFGLVVMTTGGNDIIHDYGKIPPREGAMFGATMTEAAPWIANFEKRLAEMLDLIDARFPGGCHVFLADIYDPTDGTGSAVPAGLPSWPDGLSVLAEYNGIIRSACAARPNVHLVKIHDAFLGHGIYHRQFWRAHYRSSDPHYWYYPNFEDPNDRGYDAIRRLMLNEIVAATSGIWKGDRKSADMRARAEKLVRDLPEVRAWEKQFASAATGVKLGVTVSPPAGGGDSAGPWVVLVTEERLALRRKLVTFHVSPESGKIQVLGERGRLQSLEVWRRSQR